MKAYLGSASSRGSSSSDDADESPSPANYSVIGDVHRRLDLPAIAKSEFIAAVLYYAGLLEHDDGRDTIQRISVREPMSRPSDGVFAASSNNDTHIISVHFNTINAFSSSSSAAVNTQAAPLSRPFDCSSYFCPSSFSSKGPPIGVHGAEINGGAVPEDLINELLMSPAHLSRGHVDGETLGGRGKVHRGSAVRPSDSLGGSLIGGVGASLIVGANYHAEWILKRKV